jgi:hypothetical protein
VNVGPLDEVNQARREMEMMSGWGQKLSSSPACPMPGPVQEAESKGEPQQVSKRPITEVAGRHSIISSARDSSDGDRTSPSAFAIFRLIKSANLVA